MKCEKSIEFEEIPEDGLDEHNLICSYAFVSVKDYENHSSP